MSEIPTIDCRNNIPMHADAILEATETVGFVYLKNIGICFDQVINVIETANKFWELPSEVKMKYAKRKFGSKGAGNSGFVPAGMERLDPTNATEIREAFNITPGEGDNMSLPDDVVPEFRTTVLDFFDSCKKASFELMRSLAAALKLDVDFFEKTHAGIGNLGNGSTLRLLHYPPLPESIPPKSSRCGEHSDYGTITLLFQDEVGGLEVRRRDGTFIPATPQPQAVLLNTGDLLQRWTSDRLIAVRHRVLVPEDRSLYFSSRRSIAFFVQPDDDCLVAPLDGSNAYEPITTKQHLMNMFSKTY